MAPKPKTKAGGIKSTNKTIDDFLAQTTVPAGMMERQENEKKQVEKQKELKEKFLTQFSMTSI
jgi:hypothetical protein